MYRIGDKVMYGMHGVCMITDLEQRMVDSKMVTYLVLEPPGQAGSRYMVPSHNAAAMAKIRPVLSRAEIEDLLASGPVRADGWIPDEGKRKQRYRELSSGCDRVQLACMLCTLYRRRAELFAASKKLHMCDENFLRDAEKILSGEIAAAMNLTPADALKYLRKKITEGT